MDTKKFVADDSIMLKIWGTTDITLFIFAGAAAEFALNKQVDWLYYTGKLPADPIGRLFSTVEYAQQIIFQREDNALRSVDKINSIHKGVEKSRGRNIPASAYKDVLFMLIHYSISAYELLERKMKAAEKDEVVSAFSRIGQRMNLNDLPGNYDAFVIDYDSHIRANLVSSNYTKDLFRQYRKHLGVFRYFLVIEVQRMLVSPAISRLLNLKKPRIAHLLVPMYKLIRRTRLSDFLVEALVPLKFKEKVKQMNKINRGVFK